MSLAMSMNLKELPDLSNATNLEILNMHRCFGLVEIPSSIRNLQKLKRLLMGSCINLQVVPTHFNLASLECVDIFTCGQLRKFPDIFRNITTLSITDTMLQDLPKSIRLWSRLQVLMIYGSDTEEAEIYLKGRCVDIEKIPDCIKDLHGLKELHIYGCPKIASLPQLPGSLRRLVVNHCESLETLMPFPLESPIEALYFSNCMKLGQEARRVVITQQSREANIPREFDHRAIGNSLIIPSGTKEYMLCVVVSPKQQMKETARFIDLLWRRSRNGFPSEEKPLVLRIPKLTSQHSTLEAIVAKMMTIPLLA